ncbi:unnamed protein product [Closterium sp. NIES-53]
MATQGNCGVRLPPVGVVPGVHEVSLPPREVEREPTMVGPVPSAVESQRANEDEDVAEQCKKFTQFVHDKRRERGIETTWIINIDQTPLWLEMPATATVGQTGVRSVPIRSAGYQKKRVTVMLACTADRMKLKPWFFFKQKTVPKGVFLPAMPADLIKRAFLTCGISNALDGSEDGLAMAHRRSQLTAEVDVDDSIIADGFFGNNYQEPESDEEESIF